MTWNPTTGCTKISDGCKFCYAEVMTKRLKGMGQGKYRNGFNLTIHPQTLDDPYTWKNPKMIFVNSMSDLFHEDVPITFIQSVFKVMNECPQHIFQILTKRAHILSEYSRYLSWSDNIWMGVTVENNSLYSRIDYLRHIPAHIKFLSLEPLLSGMPKMNLDNIEWVIVGGESGSKARPVKEDWIMDIKDQCAEKGIPFFFKQWGGKNKKVAGKLLKGKLYNEFPKSKIQKI
jgi:protein gp37